MDTKISALLSLPTSHLACSSSTSEALAFLADTSVSVSRVIRTVAPSAVSSFFSAWATRKVTPFSVTPVGPMAPTSLPPWPASRAITLPCRPGLKLGSLSDSTVVPVELPLSWLMPEELSEPVLVLLPVSVFGCGLKSMPEFLLLEPRLPKSITTL